MLAAEYEPGDGDELVRVRDFDRPFASPGYRSWVIPVRRACTSRCRSLSRGRTRRCPRLCRPAVDRAAASCSESSDLEYGLVRDAEKTFDGAHGDSLRYALATARPASLSVRALDGHRRVWRGLPDAWRVALHRRTTAHRSKIFDSSRCCSSRPMRCISTRSTASTSSDADTPSCPS